MRKINTKGFTLIELLAVITIMGILMLVAIPAVSRTIENSRKDTFINTVQKYCDGASTMWAADNLTCSVGSDTFVSSAVPNGTYYVNVSSVSTDNTPQLLEKGGKSSWGQRDIKGYIIVNVSQVGTGASATRKVTFTPVLSDGVHGININVPDTGTATEASTKKESKNLVRGDLVMLGATYQAFKTTATCVEN